MLLILCPLMVHARYRSGVGYGDYHFGYISVGGGYTSLSQNIPEASTRGDLGYLLGAGYEFRMHNAWVSVGVQYMQEKSRSKIGEYDFNTPFGGLDDQNQKVNFYRYTIRQEDKQEMRTVDIPLMAGYYNNGFYVGAGFKFGFSVGSTITSGGDFDLKAQYDRYQEGPDAVFGNWGYYTNYPCPNKKYDFKMRTQISLIGEIGYDLLSTMDTKSTVCHMLKIGVYAEYGLRSVIPDDLLDPVSVCGMNMIDAAKAEADVCDARMNPYYMSTKSEGRRMVPFFVGIKLTYLIGGSWSSTATWHKGCQCYGN